MSRQHRTAPAARSPASDEATAPPPRRPATSSPLRPARGPSVEHQWSLSICKVWQLEYPWDVRAEKIARALTDAGHRVHLLARNWTRLPEREALPEATVHRMAPWSWAPPWLDRASMFPAWLNPRWVRLITRVARRTGSEVILCRDLPLAVASVLAARRLRIPVILDMAENYPAMFASRHATGRAKSWGALVRSPRVARLVERWVLPRVDGVLVVVEESRARLVALGVPADRIAIVSNTPPLARLDASAASHTPGGVLKLVYLGKVEEERGIGTLLEATGLLRAEGCAVALTVYGHGRDLAFFQARARALGLEPPAVVFRGRVPNPLALAELADMHVGVIPHWTDEQINTTVPNKLFDYMAAGLPVVTADAVPLKRIVESCGCGVVYRARDAADLARALRALRDAPARQLAASRGRAAVRGHYHWERDVDRMLALVASVVA
ncbi:MAG TPA: glycosyltransferase [Gemmatimonadales bacterium]|nr:glycosyltransferase [Gemmatimonadales bacterium]